MAHLQPIETLVQKINSVVVLITNVTCMSNHLLAILLEFTFCDSPLTNENAIHTTKRPTLV